MDKSTTSWSKVFSPQRIVGGVVVTIFASIVSYGYWVYIPNKIDDKIDTTVNKKIEKIVTDGQQLINNLEKFKQAFKKSDRIFTEIRGDINKGEKSKKAVGGVSTASCDEPRKNQTIFLVGCSCNSDDDSGSCAGSYERKGVCHATSNSSGKVRAYAYCVEAKTISINFE